MTPAEQVHAARALATTPDPATAGVWPRAGALLARQALERGLAVFWDVRAPGLAELPARTQLICLPGYLGDDVLAGAIAWTWAELSQACHHRGYALGPTAGELDRLFTAVELALVRLCRP